VEAYRTASVASSLLHLDQRIGNGDGGETTLGELIEEADPTMLPAEQVERRELTGTLRVAIEHLPEVQREVVERYYFQGEFLRDIADDMGVTEARVSQIRSEALNAVRAYFATGFDTVPSVDERAPGRRSRAAFVAHVGEHTSWRERMDAADRPLQAVQRTA
jgi:RNA polymerase sigma factor FliA